MELVGKSRGKEYFGQEEVSANVRHIRKLTFDHSIHVEAEIEEKIAEADLILFAPGSLYTSILPHLLAPEICKALDECSAPLMYVCNLVTQPGETDGYSVGDHVKTLNRYLKNRRIEIVLANNSVIDPEVQERYLTTENKRIVPIDYDRCDKLGLRVIADDIFTIDEEEKIRHNAMKTAFRIFSYLMEDE